MKKVIFQGIIMIAFFVGSWFLLSKVNWTGTFKLQEKTDNIEKKLGEVFWDVFKNTGKEIKDKKVVNTIDSIVKNICKANSITNQKIKLHILDKDEINAFALPDGHLVVYSGLISRTANQEELAGVVGHELAHIELNHVMKKLIQEIGFSVLTSMAGEGGGSKVIKEAAKLLSSTAYDRKLEKDADIKAVDFLNEANINPVPFSDFLYKMSEKETETIQKLSWISTHPDSKERAAYVLEYCKNKKKKYQKVVTSESWEKMKETIVID